MPVRKPVLGNLLISAICVLALSACSSGSKKDTSEAAASADDITLDDSSKDTVDPVDNASQDIAADSLSDGDLNPPAEQSANAPPVVENSPSEDFPPEIAPTPAPEPTLDPAPVAQNLEPAPVPEPMADIAPAPVPVADNNSSGLAEITGLRYRSSSGGRVEIETSSPATYRTREVPNLNQIVIEVANVRLPAKFKRPLITKEFKQSVASVDAYQDPGSSTARIVVQLRGPGSADIQQSGKVITIASGSAAPFETSPDVMDSLADNTDILEESPSVQSQQKAGKSLQGTIEDLNGPVNYYGKPISIEVRDTSVRDVIQLIAEQSGANIVVADEVKGNVTIKLRQVPWDQALMIVMKSKNLGYVRQGSVLRVAPNDMLQAETETNRKYLESQKNIQPLRVKVIPVSYAKVSDLEKQVTNFLSTRGKAVADQRTSALVVTDITENLDRIANLVKALDTPPLQVIIEGKVVEARESFGRDLGIRWSSKGKEVQSGDQVLKGKLNVSPGTLAGNGLALDLTYGTIDVLGDLAATLALYEIENQVKVISSPRIVAMNNEEALIKQVTGIPIPQQSQVNGVTTTSFTYKDMPLSLKVTPQITSDADVIMQVEVERQFPGSIASGASQPEINTRNAKTKVMVRNGQTSVIGGIYQSDAAVTDEGVPGLRNIPVLGWLFKHKQRQELRNELLLFLTPRILASERSSASPEEAL